MKPSQKFLSLLLVCSLFMGIITSGINAQASTSSFSFSASSIRSIQKQLTAKASAPLKKILEKQQMAALKTKVANYLKSNQLSSGEWNIYVKNLKSNRSFSLYNRQTIAASTIKLYAMAAAYDKISKKELSASWDLNNKLYNMIAYSDNDSFNSIARTYVGLEYLNTFIQKQGFKQTEVFKGIAPGSHPFIQQTTPLPGNVTSASDCGKLLEKIYRGTLVSKSASKAMLNLLKSQTYRSKIPAGIPSGVTVANKTGEFDEYQHDAAIVYGKKTPYVICIFSHSSDPSIYHIRRISQIVYQYLN